MRVTGSGGAIDFLLQIYHEIGLRYYIVFEKCHTFQKFELNK